MEHTRGAGKYNHKQQELIKSIFNKNPEISQEEFTKKTKIKFQKQSQFSNLRWYYHNRITDSSPDHSVRSYVRKSNSPVMLRLFEIETKSMSLETKTAIKQVFIRLNETKKFNLNAVELVDPAVIEVREMSK